MFGITNSRRSPVDSDVFYFEEYSASELDELYVGRKGLSLFKLRDLEIPVPDFFVVSPKVYKSFMKNAFEDKIAKAADKKKNLSYEQIEKLIKKTGFDESVREELLHAYSRLSGFGNAWVSVRSSIVYPDDHSVSFSGVFHTELSIRGFDNLVAAIKNVYVSMFRDNVLIYAKEKNVDVSKLTMSVVVQKMIQPEVAGISYTVDPITNDKNRISVEAVFGLGDVIADGEITPDQYILDKSTLAVLEKHISPQEWMRIRKSGDGSEGSSNSYQKIQISKSWSHQQKLEDSNIQEVAKVSLIAEERMKTPLLLEWVWEGGNVWVLQSKDIVVNKPARASKPAGDVNPAATDTLQATLEMVKEEKQAEEAKQPSDESEKNTAKSAKPEKKGALGRLSGVFSRARKEDKKKHEGKPTKATKKAVEKVEKVALSAVKDANDHFKFTLSGLGSSIGVAYGYIKVIDAKSPSDTFVNKDTVLLLKSSDKSHESFILKAGGVITDDGGLTSDISILCRELGIPAIVGTAVASDNFKDNDIVRIDGNSGSIYLYDTNYKPPEKVEKEESKAAEVQKVDTRVKDKVETIGKGDTEDGVEATMTVHDPTPAAQAQEETSKEKKTVAVDKIPTATKVFSTSNLGALSDKEEGFILHSDGIALVDLDQFLLDQKRHPAALIKERKFNQVKKSGVELLDKLSDVAGADQVIVSVGAATVEAFRSLVKGKEMESKELSDSTNGVSRMLSDKKLARAVLEIVKDARNKTNSRNISLAIHGPLNGSLFTEFKKEVTSSGLKRSSSFDLYAVIESPTECILTEEFINAGIDGFILHAPRIARQMQGLKIDAPNAKHDLSAKSVWKVIDSCHREAKSAGLKSLIYVERSKPLTKHLINNGVYGVIVDREEVKKLKRYASDQEAKMFARLEG